MEPSDKADTSLKREMQLAAYRHDLSRAVKVDDLAQYYLKNGMDPHWIAYRFGVALERCQRYAEALKQSREKQSEREQPVRSHCKTPSVGASDNGPGGVEEVQLPAAVGSDL